MEHPNAELYRRITAAFQAGDLDTVRDALAPALRWHEAGSAEVIGRDAVLARMSGAVPQLEGSVAVHDVLANDEHVVALINVDLRTADGSEIGYRAVEVAHVGDGVITERWCFMDACPPDVTGFFDRLG